MNEERSAATSYLYLIRHGATDANLQKPNILQGCGIDLPLSETGRGQAKAVAAFLREVPLRAVYSSHLKRAVETGRAIAGDHRLDVVTIKELAECDVGQWEGKDWGSIMRDYPEHYRAFMDDPSRNPYLGGETYSDVLRRVQPAFERLFRQHAGEAFAVVAHNVVNRVYLASLMGHDLSRAKEIQQTNTGVNLIRCRNGEATLITLNSVFHLDQSQF